MIFASLALAAAAPALDQPVEQDLRCAVVMVLLVARAEETGKAEASRKFALMTEYFLGKLDARVPDLDFAYESKRIVQADGYVKQITADFERCNAEFLRHQDRLREQSDKLKVKS